MNDYASGSLLTLLPLFAVTSPRVARGIDGWKIGAWESESEGEQEAGGSSSGPIRRRRYIYREREEAEERLIDDYFGDDEYEPKYPEETFRRRYRMSSTLFNKIVNDILSYDVQPIPEYFTYFSSRLDATGRKSIGPILKCTSAIRQLAYGTAPDAFDEYLQIAERTSRECLDNFTKCIHVLYNHKFLRRPSATDIEKTYKLHEEKHGLPGMLGSIDCMHWDWKNCPKLLHGQFKRRDHKYPTLMDAKTFKFKTVQEAARKDIERAFGVLQEPNMVRSWVERCDLHVRKAKELRDGKMHVDLRQDLGEHLWNNQ
ncbi:RNA-directed DNA polymerase, eukaryota [Tanacetum coccineum]|uniref:RNA-directed DNA polymerase, eukaryota n=1 Tax=Tanacetum coccineum TaxID=301880 RepID=A0ABQ4X471_9ASTR